MVINFGAVVQGTPPGVQTTGVNPSVEMIYQSEETQGKMTFYGGLLAVVVAFFLKSYWIAIGAIIVAAYGYARMQRADATKNAYYQQQAGA